MVDQLNVRADDALEAGVPRPKTQVRVFPIHEETLVEPAEPFPKFATNQEITTADRVHLALAVPLPRPQILRIEQPGPAENGREPDPLAEHAPHRWRPVARVVIQVAAGKVGASAYDP